MTGAFFVLRSVFGHCKIAVIIKSYIPLQIRVVGVELAEFAY